jgi:flagellar protein FliO/FliZ
MTQTLSVVVLFIAGMACLPWLVRWVQQRKGVSGMSATVAASKVVSAVAIGPQQRVVTVEVGPEHARTLLILGVTAQHVSCLHAIPVASVRTSTAESPISFAQEMAQASALKESDA